VGFVTRPCLRKKRKKGKKRKKRRGQGHYQDSVTAILAKDLPQESEKGNCLNSHLVHKENENQRGDRSFPSS
jgi:hypothetical protein